MDQISKGKRLCITLTVLLATGAVSFAQFEKPIPKAVSLLPVKDTVTVTFLGDMMMHSKQLEYDCSSFIKELGSITADADISIANLEFTLAGKPYSGYPAFSAPDSYAEDLASKGVDIFLTANNHILDKGSSGLRRTLSVYDRMRDSLGIRYTGSAADEESYRKTNPLMIVCRGMRFALINFTYGTNSPRESSFPRVSRMEKENVGAMVESAKKLGADFIIALPHWGNEYQLRHSKSQEEWAQWLVSQGVDLIIGTHPHVVQDSTHIEGVPVIYSLGNAVSNMSAVNTRLELAVRASFVRDSSGALVMLEPELDFLWCTLPGRLTDNYCTIRVEDYLGRRDEWKQKNDYDNMLSTLARVKEATGIGKLKAEAIERKEK